MAHAQLEPEKPRQRHAWLLLLVVWLATLALGFQWFSESSKTAAQWSWLSDDSEVIGYVKSILIMFGATTVGFSIFGITVTATAFRTGEKWAWYVSWYLPLHMGIVASLHTWPIPLTLGLVAVAIVGLWLPRRKFFPAGREFDWGEGDRPLFGCEDNE